MSEEGSGLSAVSTEERDACIAEIHRRTTRFIRRNGVVLEIDNLDKRELDDAIENIWQELEGMPFGDMMQHRLGDELPPKLAFFLFYAVVAERYRFELPKLHDEPEV